MPAFRHSTVPVVTPDLLYLDGPALTAQRQVAVDPLDIEPRLSSGSLIVVDGRIRNVLFLREHLQRTYFSVSWWDTSLFGLIKRVT